MFFEEQGAAGSQPEGLALGLQSWASLGPHVVLHSEVASSFGALMQHTVPAAQFTALVHFSEAVLPFCPLPPPSP